MRWLGLLAVLSVNCSFLFSDDDPETVPPNLQLASLSVSDGVLEPPFDPDITSYSVDVPLMIANTTIDAVPEAETATVEVVGGTDVALELGENIVQVVVRDGDQTQTTSISLNRGTVWEQGLYAKASNTDTLDQFGAALALFENTMIVGAPNEASANTNEDDNTALSSGAAYVFREDNQGTWVQEKYLKAPDPVPNTGDLFGTSVDIENDYVVIGSPAEDSAAQGPLTDNSVSDAGAVFFYERVSTVWGTGIRIKADDAASFERFGTSVALAGETLLVGAPQRRGGGAVYLFERNSETRAWEQQAILLADNPDDDDLFGASIATDGTVLVVGAPGESSDGIDPNSNNRSAAGAAYVFRLEGSSWIFEEMLKPTVVGAGDRFGQRVAVDGNRILIGAPLEAGGLGGPEADPGNNTAVEAGAAYTFRHNGSTWMQDAYLKPERPATGDQFGISVSLAGNVAVVGAYLEDGNSPDSDRGAVYLFADLGDWRQVGRLEADNAGAGDYFGFRVDTHDGRILIGASHEASAEKGVNATGEDNQAPRAGAAYLFEPL